MRAKHSGAQSGTRGCITYYHVVGSPGVKKFFKSGIPEFCMIFLSFSMIFIVIIIQLINNIAHLSAGILQFPNMSYHCELQC